MSPSAPWALSGCWRCSSEHHHNVPALRAHETLDRHCPEITGPRGRVQILPRGSCPDARSGHFAHSRLGPLDSVPHLGQHPRAELEFQSRDGAERPGLPAGRVRGLESVRGVFIARTTALRYGDPTASVGAGRRASCSERHTRAGRRAIRTIQFPVSHVTGLPPRCVNRGMRVLFLQAAQVLPPSRGKVGATPGHPALCRCPMKPRTCPSWARSGPAVAPSLVLYPAGTGKGRHLLPLPRRDPWPAPEGVGPV